MCKDNKFTDINVNLSRPYRSDDDDRLLVSARIFPYGFDADEFAFLDIEVPTLKVIGSYHLDDDDIRCLCDFAEKRADEFIKVSMEQYSEKSGSSQVKEEKVYER